MKKETLTEHELQNAINLIVSGEYENIALSLQLLSAFYTQKQIRQMIVDRILMTEFERNFEDFKAYQRANVVPEVVERSIIFHHKKMTKYLRYQYSFFIRENTIVSKNRALSNAYFFLGDNFYDRQVYKRYFQFTQKFKALKSIMEYYSTPIV